MFATLCATCIVKQQMIRAGGTSMAAPMVSGAAALLLQKYPNLTPNRVKSVLMASARMVNGRFPAVDGYAAIKAVAAGNVPVANQGLTPNPLVSASTATSITRTRPGAGRAGPRAGPNNGRPALRRAPEGGAKGAAPAHIGPAQLISGGA